MVGLSMTWTNKTKPKRYKIRLTFKQLQLKSVTSHLACSGTPCTDTTKCKSVNSNQTIFSYKCQQTNKNSS